MLSDLPINEELLIYFVAHCVSRLNLSHSTIKQYLCGIKFRCQENNVVYPDLNQLSGLEKVLNGAKRMCERKSNTTRCPITFDILKNLCLWLRKCNSVSNFLLETVCTIGFFGFLRCGEFTVDEGHEFDPFFNLCISDLVITSDYALLKLKVSKTDPFRQGINIKLFPTNDVICPYKIASTYVQSRILSNPNTQDPLFVDSCGKALSRNKYISALRHALCCCGYDSSKYSGHSLRQGAATSAGAAHVQDHLIKILGRWSSEAYCRYIKTSDSEIKLAQNALIKM